MDKMCDESINKFETSHFIHGNHFQLVELFIFHPTFQKQSQFRWYTNKELNFHLQSFGLTFSNITEIAAQSKNLNIWIEIVMSKASF